jgi:hypothetical protein
MLYKRAKGGGKWCVCYLDEWKRHAWGSVTWYISRHCRVKFSHICMIYYYVILILLNKRTLAPQHEFQSPKSKKVHRKEGRIAMHGLAKANSFRRKKGQCASRKEAVGIIQV